MSDKIKRIYENLLLYVLYTVAYLLCLEVGLDSKYLWMCNIIGSIVLIKTFNDAYFTKYDSSGNIVKLDK